ncbi:MAG: hypothetical protein M3N48_06540 [Verrucomicrobiota bacterium]|nr:hypothetical protein [Verrucomicrobiota bacterium]
MNSISLDRPSHFTAEITSRETTTARDYQRAYAGKVMIIQRNDNAPLATGDFFELDGVGTHPTGLIVTGLFENGRRSHMMATAVRVANRAEIEWRAGRN